MSELIGWFLLALLIAGFGWLLWKVAADLYLWWKGRER